jgi:hypothetical protein
MGAIYALYEIITGEMPYLLELGESRKGLEVLDKEWVHGSEFTLECDLLEYRKILREWIHRRKRPGNAIIHYTEASEYITWPVPYVPKMSTPDDPKIRPWPFLSHALCKLRGIDFIEWRRPASSKIPDGYCVLGNGELPLKPDLEEFEYESDTGRNGT